MAAVRQITVGAEVGGDEGPKLVFIGDPGEISLREEGLGVVLHNVVRHFSNLLAGVGDNSLECVVLVVVKDPLVGDATDEDFVVGSAATMHSPWWVLGVP